MNKVRYGIVGIGKQGYGYAKKLYAGKDGNAVLAAVCDKEKDRRDKAAAEMPGVKIYDNYKDMLDKNVIDAVIIDTPHYLHPTIGIEALERGLHVLSDKPIGVYTKAVRELNECADRHPELKFGVLYNQRTNSMYRKARDIVAGGEIGRASCRERV